MPEATTSQFPPTVLDHIYGESLESWYRKFSEEQHLLGIERDVIDESVWKVYTRESTLDNFFRELENLFGTPERAKAIGIPILGNDFLKIEDYLGIDIPAYIKALGGNPSLFVKEIPVADVVAGVMRGIGVAPSDPAIAKRIEHAVTSFLTGIRDQLETKDVLMRGTKVGGVGLDAATAERIVAALTIQLKELRDAGVIIRTEATKPPETSTFHLVKASKSSVMQPEDEAEIEQIRRKIVPGDVVGEKIRAAVDRVIQKTGAKFTPHHFAEESGAGFKRSGVEQRFRTAIESRVRDIRDYAETLDLLTRPSAQGGFGIPKEQAEKVLKVMEEEVRALHMESVPPLGVRGGKGELPSDRNPPQPSLTLREGIPPPTTPVLPSPPPVATLVHPVPPKPPPPPSKPQAASPKPQAVPPTPPPPIPKPVPPPSTKPVPPPPREITTLPESTSLRREAPAAGAPRNDMKLAPVAPPPALKPPPQLSPTRSPSREGEKKDGVVKQIPIASPPARPQAPPPVPPLGARGGKGELAPDRNPSPPPLAPRGGVAESPPPPVISVQSVAIPARGGQASRSVSSVSTAKPKMQDIRPVPPRLVGPIEELQQLALADFRKIAKTPADAAQRIAEKLALLEKDSYTKRAEGVKALRGSALMAAYAEVVNAALLAKRKVEDEVKERGSKDKQALTLEEFRALGGLNARLRL